MQYDIHVSGKPIAKKRPRFFRRGGFVGTYNPQETEEGRWLLEAKGQIPAMLEGAVIANMTFLMPIPKTLRKRDVALVDAGEFYHTKKPDLDNLVKFVKDCLNGVAWRDDSQVVKITATKVYGKEPGTRITLMGNAEGRATL
jgi:Holliday junction resolvase RusA-like endonuclease